MSKKRLYVWDVKEDVLAISQKWYLLLAAFLMGAVLGIGLTYIFPAQNRAVARLLVTFNVDADFEVPDDYKHWQMAQLEGFLTSDQVLLGVQDKLTEEFGDRELFKDLESALALEWRNAGVWEMVATHPEADVAEAAVTAWRDVGLAEIDALFVHAQESYELNLEMVGLKDLQTANREAKNALERAQKLIIEEAWAAEETEDNRLILLEALDILVDDEGLAELVPEREGPFSAYEPLFAELKERIPPQIARLDVEYREREVEYDELETAWMDVSKKAKQLSVFLTVEPKSQKIAVTVNRAVGTAGLIGGMTGLFGWLLIALMQIGWKKDR